MRKTFLFLAALWLVAFAAYGIFGKKVPNPATKPPCNGCKCHAR
jgi:hypothetical protein